MRKAHLLTGFSLLALVACKRGDAGGTPDGGGPDGGACVAPAVPGPPGCAECLVARCCLTASSCAGNTDCVAIEGCLAGDADAGSADAGSCAEGHEAGVWIHSGLDVCRRNQCADACGAPAATCGGIVPDPASCLAAVDALCCEETDACGKSDACVALLYQCLDQNGCGTTGPCYEACRALYPAALPAFDAMASCWAGITC